ncbi:MAG: hypothetical protein KJ915_10155 [Candidatus Omnitrophica bacterium]|nr:hypothetical protein [Candidatus Omnitrophota bacterium]
MPSDWKGKMHKFNLAVKDAIRLLSENTEWVSRYSEYAKAIVANRSVIKDKKKMFHQWSPLYLYMNVNRAKSCSPTFSLRYFGQDVAYLNISGKEVKLKDEKCRDNTKYGKLRRQNQRDFGCSIDFHDKKWTGTEARNFRKYFLSNPARNRKNNKGNEEHRVEDLLLTEFSKRQGRIKKTKLHNIQPIKIAGVARFQMPTPFGASGKQVKYSKKGGGIDILARVGKGRGTTICVMEVKDEYLKKEPPQKAITQGLYYATFIRELLRSSCGNDWWNLFGFSGTVRKKLNICVCCVMPFNKSGDSDKSFGGYQMPIENDTFELHYMYFSEDGKINNIKTSIGGRIASNNTSRG